MVIFSYIKIRQVFTLLAISLFCQNLTAQQVSDYYVIQDVPVPDDIILEVGGLAFNDQGQLGVCTRRGEIWLIDNPTSDNPVFNRFAHGLHEPLGLNYRDGSFYCAQRGELTKITDLNGGGKADVFETIFQWDLDGNYHEYAYGPVFTEDGDMLIALNLGWIGFGASLSQWDGWVLKVSEDGTVEPFATGMRSPAGIGFNAQGDFFYTENQGDWVGSGRMTHVEKGDFVGNPAGLKWTGLPGSPLSLTPEDIDDSKGLTLYEYSKEIEAIKPPSVWFPHTLMGISTSSISVIGDNFGPFKGQLLVGDQGHSKVMRVFQEKVNGVYQGICFPFVEGFASGVLRTMWSQDEQTLFVGMTSRGWASTGKSPYALQKLAWTGKTPFDMQRVEIQPDGFLITFTQPVDQAKASDPASYQITDFTYKYHRTYGSPVTDQQKRTIESVSVSEDGLSAKLVIDQFRLGYIYEIKAPGITNSGGQPLLNNFGYYTVNEVPAGGHTSSTATSGENSPNEDTDVNPKNMTSMPASWTDGPDEVLTIGTEPGLKFDQSYLMVKPGQKIKLEFNNPDDMLHNLVIVNPGKADEIGKAAMNLGLDGEAMQYVPDSDDVLFYTGLLQPKASTTLYFEAPKTPGNYQYVCTFPGHATTMRGILQVK